jgi:hypothetical protein
MTKRSALRERLKRLSQEPAPRTDITTDVRVAPAVELLTEAVLDLDQTSTFLAGVNIIVALLILLFGGLQIFIMLRGH